MLIQIQVFSGERVLFILGSKLERFTAKNVFLPLNTVSILETTQGNRKLKVEELHSDLQYPANTRLANPRPLYYSDFTIALRDNLFLNLRLS